MAHTSTPWTFGPTGATMHSYSQPFAIAESGYANLVAGCFGDVRGGEDVAHANAAFIVRACNCHDDLVAALKAVTDHFAAVMSGPLVSGFVTFANGVEGIPTIADARAALAKVEQST